MVATTQARVLVDTFVGKMREWCGGERLLCHRARCPGQVDQEMTAVGFEPTQLALVELESTPLDHSGKVS